MATRRNSYGTSIPERPYLLSFHSWTTPRVELPLTVIDMNCSDGSSATTGGHMRKPLSAFDRSGKVDSDAYNPTHSESTCLVVTHL
ncbi:hypothetical protein M514_11667 [Trichuris suis]|uniref:Uncharacterized protein n=1 Tax=Trichuris suis TaxID=68888 RepID=A0A085LR46_9BILA|nr:hypothetical protein M513_11667 [Trichuris suis]KFD60625.1 hypothetical protein M514_11667 [Trichuris suis]